MSLITQCPACFTMFRIVQDQLRISNGWVRCGQCDQVFDANTPFRTQEKSGRSVHAGTFSTQLEDFSVDKQIPKPHAVPPQKLMEPVALDGHDHAVLSFMPVLQTERNSTWGIWASKPLAILVCGVLALLLAAQWVFIQRNRLAAMYAPIRPALQATCDVLNCVLAPLRQIESITIESSSFTRVKEGVYLLQASLKNGADFALVAPALELTLTDTLDHVLLRWVISADEYSGKQRLMSAGKEMAVSVPFSVHSEVAADAILGYKLLAFYP